MMQICKMFKDYGGCETADVDINKYLQAHPTQRIVHISYSADASRACEKVYVVFEETGAMTPSEFAKKARENNLIDDTPTRHMRQDTLMEQVLSSLGYDEGIKAMTDTVRWYE